MAFKRIKDFIRHEAFSGLLLMATALLALIIDNSPWYLLYQRFTDLPLWQHSLQHWINHGLMTFFFITVGLEIKRELMQGELNSLKKAALPCAAALGGMIVPALMYLGINAAEPHLWHGWAIPMATDIAFSLGVMQLLGKRCPLALKVFLMALATFDDLGAVLAIAVFYSHGVNTLMLGLATLMTISLYALNLGRVKILSPYLIVGALLWFFTSQSGIDAAISGIIIAFSVPLKIHKQVPAKQLEKHLHPWVAYGILPLFSFVNAGVHLLDIEKTEVFSTLTLGIAFALLLGKPIGVLAFSWFSIKCRLATLPTQVNWQQLIGVAFLCGIGFTMSLFIGELAFVGNSLHYAREYRLGIIAASVLAGLIGFYWLKKHGLRDFHNRSYPVS
jgi:NhaA family Na+:H+ antiporter